MSGTPGPARRLLRNRPRLVAVALLAVTVMAASVLQSTAATVLQQTLDESWRGAYDILVTQAGKPPDSNGYLRSDALTDATTGRLSWDDLERIRALPGVEVAAPIAEVAFAESSLTGEAVLWLPVPVRADASLENPQAFRITVTGTTNDGLADRDLAVESVFAFAYQPSFSQIVFDATGAPLLDENGDTVYATTELADSPRLLTADAPAAVRRRCVGSRHGTIALGLVVAPRPVARIALVDPVAERELLGEAGAFLDPLVDALLVREPGDAHPIVQSSRDEPIVGLAVTIEEYDAVQPGAAGAEAVEQAQGTGFLQNGQLAPRSSTIPRRTSSRPTRWTPARSTRRSRRARGARRPRPGTGAGGDRQMPPSGRGRTALDRRRALRGAGGRRRDRRRVRAAAQGIRDVRPVRGGPHLGQRLTRFRHDVQQAVRLGRGGTPAGWPCAVRGRRRVLGGCPARHPRRTQLHAPRLV